MSVRITGWLLNDVMVEDCNFECRALARSDVTAFGELLAQEGYVVLETIDERPRFFLFTGSRISETRSREQAERLGALLVESELLGENSPRTDAFHNYRQAVEISGGLTTYSEKNGDVEIQSSTG